MGNSFRNQPLPTRYGEAKTPVTEDVLQIGLLFAFGIIAVSFIAIIPGIRGRERLWACIRVFVALWIGAILLVCNFGSWYADSICTTTQYKAHAKPNSPQLIQATVGISISLRGFNVTLEEKEDGCGSEEYERPFPGEEINYVESFRWAPTWNQGRLDFGIYGGQFRQSFRAAQYRGMPYPILWVAETFLFDGEEYLWYRRFRVSGWLTHIWLWTGFAIYLISIILFISNVRQGAHFMFLTGVLMCLACLTYGVGIQNDPPLVIHFPDAVLRPKFNYSFYLTGATGVLTAFSACVIILVDMLYPRKIATLFHHALTLEDTTFEGVIEGDFEERRSSRKPSLAPRKFSLIGGVGLEGKVRRVRTLTRIRESLRRSFQASIRSNRSTGGCRSDVLPRRKSIASLSSESTTTSPVQEHTDLVVEKGGVFERPHKSKQQIVEAIIEEAIVEEEPDLEESSICIEKQISVKQKQRVVFMQEQAEEQCSIKWEHVQSDDTEKQHSTKQEQHAAEQSAMMKQHSIEQQVAKPRQVSVAEQGSVAMPQQQGSMPLQQVSVSTPLQQVSVSMPLQQASVAAPQQEGSIAMPQQRGSIATPQQRGSIATPQQRGSIATPQQQGSIAMPQQQGSVATPQQQGFVATPQQQGSVATPQQQGSIATPQQRGSVAMPQQRGSIATPQQWGSIAMPQQQGSIATPEQQGSVATPQQRGSVAMPQQQGSIATPEQQGSIATPQQQGSIATPQQRGSIATPQQRGSVEVELELVPIKGHTPVQV